jgi:hypothetical protein
MANGWRIYQAFFCRERVFKNAIDFMALPEGLNRARSGLRKPLPLREDRAGEA